MTIQSWEWCPTHGTTTHHPDNDHYACGCTTNEGTSK